MLARVALTFSFFASWLAGGVVLLTSLLLRTRIKPYALAFALIGYGGAGLAAQVLALAPWRETAAGAVACALALGLLGYVLQRGAHAEARSPDVDPS